MQAQKCRHARASSLPLTCVLPSSAAVRPGQGSAGSLGSCQARIASFYLQSCRLTGEGPRSAQPRPTGQELLPQLSEKAGFSQKALTPREEEIRHWSFSCPEAL